MLSNVVKQTYAVLVGRLVSVRWGSNFVRNTQLKYGPMAQVVEEKQPWTELVVEEKERLEKLPDQQEPHQLHAICRIKPLKYRTGKEKKIIKKLGVHEKCNSWQIHKNTPSVNSMIAAVKHLLRVVPVSFPHGMPRHETDFDNCYLKSNGEFIVKKKIGSPITQELPKRILEDDERNKWYMDGKSLKKYNATRILDFNLNTEHFSPEYEYKYNQDGKEFRYTHNLNPSRKTKH